MKFKFHTLLALVFLVSINLHAQKLTHRQGEILIEVERGSTADKAVTFIQQKLNLDQDIIAEQVIAKPMNVWKLKFDFAEVNQREVLRIARETPDIYFAQNNHIIENRLEPNDPSFDQQWQYINTGQGGGLENADLDIEIAWDVSTGGLTANGDTIVACVIDDGLDPTHEDFGDNIWVNYGEIPDNGIDDDANGFVDDYRGWDTYIGGDDIYVGGFHGTPVTGIVGAQGNNEIGVAGVNWDVKLMIVRGGGDEANALASYAYPYIMRQKYNESNGTEGAFVVSTNASWGIDFGQEADAPLWCNFYDSLGMVGIINCGATINGDNNVDEDGDLPTSCSSDFLISVSNITRDFEKEQFAGYGVNSIDLGAFGTDTYTPQWGNTYGAFGGTSAATPHVTGAAALLYSLPYPGIMELANSDPAGAALLIKNVILNSVRKDAKFVELFKTSGVLNLGNAVGLMENIFSDCPFPLSFDVENRNLDSTFISWENVDDAISFDLRYRNVDSLEWIEVNDAVSPVLVTGLELCGIYEIQARSICSSDTSDFSFSTNFTSLGCCNAPTGLIVENDPSRVDENSLLLSWNDDQDHVGYTIEYKLEGESGVNVVETTDNLFLLQGLRFCDAYEINVIADCITGEKTESSDVVLAATACGRCTSLPYCDPPPVRTAGEWIESVTLDGQKVQTGENFGYLDNAGFFDVDLRVGTEIDLRVEKGFENGSTFDEWVRVWIDLNVDGEFSDDELFFDEGMATSKDINTTIEVQGDVSPGLTKMRVGMVFLEEPSACDDPESFNTFGEYEDYCVNLIGPCDYGLAIEEILPSESEADVLFTMVDTSIAYNVRYKKVEENDEAWETISVLDTMANITSLEECTDYVVQVRAVCLVDTSGFEAVSDTFMTAGAECINSVDDLDLSLLKLNAFPNPFSDILRLRIESQISANASILVYNLSGQVVSQKSTYLNSGENVLTIDDSDRWNAGVFFVKVIADNTETSMKVIKLGQ